VFFNRPVVAWFADVPMNVSRALDPDVRAMHLPGRDASTDQGWWHAWSPPVIIRR
jgi:hypothetical protein